MGSKGSGKTRRAASTRVYRFLRSHIVGLIALFIAINGTAIAGPSLSKLSKQVKDLKAAVANIQLQAGPQGPQGPPGPPGSGGTPSGAAGGDLAGSAYPNPTIAPNAVNSAKIADGTVGAADVNEAGLDSAVLQSRVGGTCAAGQSIRVIAQNGTVTCEVDDAGSGWALTGNSGTNPATAFLGTTDNQPLNLKVNGQRAFRLEPHATGGPNVIGGRQNSVTAGASNATIAGGGGINPTEENVVTDSNGTIGGGFANQAGNDDVETTDAANATVGGGSGNTASDKNATVGGGENNTASDNDATVGGGENNSARACG